MTVKHKLGLKPKTYIPNLKDWVLRPKGQCVKFREGGRLLGFGRDVSPDEHSVFRILYLNPDSYIEAVRGSVEFLPFQVMGYRVCKFAPAITDVIALPGGVDKSEFDMLKWLSERRKLLKLDKHSRV